MHKEIEELYKQYSARIMELDDTPLFATGTFGTLMILGVEEYEKMQKQISVLEKQRNNYRHKRNAYRNKVRVLQKQLATMENALENAIIPKFKKGQEVWFIYDENDDYNYTILNKKVMAFTYNNYEGDLFEYAMSDDGTRDTIWYGYIEERYVFATKEEAEAKLKELKKNE